MNWTKISEKYTNFGFRTVEINQGPAGCLLLVTLHTEVTVGEAMVQQTLQWLPGVEMVQSKEGWIPQNTVTWTSTPTGDEKR